MTDITNKPFHPQVSAPLQRARHLLYSISGGSARSGDVTAARLTTAQRLAYFQSPEFRDWVAFEKSHGRQVFWLKDVDKTQAAGDIFTFFFQWRIKNNRFTSGQLKVIAEYLRNRQGTIRSAGITLTRAISGLTGYIPPYAELSAAAALRLWQQKEAGGEGIGLLDFWSNVYWPSQAGMPRSEKVRQVNAFAPTYAERIYPGVKEENHALTDAGVEVVIVTNGDQELAIAAAPYLGVKPENVVGSHLIYDGDHSTGENHSYEVLAEEWAARPQPGKPLSFHYWIYTNRKRWGWDHLDEHDIVIGGRDGDSASSDGGMMIFLPPPAIGNFMIDTPGEPERLKKFHSVTSKYGWTKGQFFTLVQSNSQRGWKP
ncbi:MAG: HAD family hydrolase [Candidatus Melainabacteria bacterium]|nr:HAD family hydrolase [Candidatus Melainabacteria bacterium]